MVIFNGAPNLAKHLEEILREKDLLGNNKGEIQFIDSSNSKEKEERFYKYLK